MNFDTREHLDKLRDKASSALRAYICDIKYYNATEDALDTACELGFIADKLLDFCDEH